ncbi:MAG: alanine--tRNA ligase, partial [Erysipelotrichaceae bacterium]
MDVKYHTATHLLNAALKIVLGNHVHQMGSNITPERLRFDFSHNGKMTEEEKKETEVLVNSWINQELPVTKQEMVKEEALKIGAEAMFIDKYGDMVTIYKIGDI